MTATQNSATATDVPIVCSCGCRNEDDVYNEAYCSNCGEVWG